MNESNESTGPETETTSDRELESVDQEQATSVPVSESESEHTSAVERYSIRWIALGAFFIFMVIFGAERMVLSIVNSEPETERFFSEAQAMVASGNISDEEKAQLRQETLFRLNKPAVWAIGAAIAFSPFLVGLFLGFFTGILKNAPIGCFTGVFAAMILLGSTFSIGMIVGGVIFSIEGFLGSLLGRKLSSR